MKNLRMIKQVRKYRDVDGKLKEVLDLLMKNNPDYKNYTEIVRDAFFDGINSMIREHK